ncbi:uncharacterized protein [Temnothorax nylanderi]|uniref:uncharacterized protein n=1 Tax=Temnothorax nylanderi TaxID=102681 RepID=UPI003A863469
MPHNNNNGFYHTIYNQFGRRAVRLMKAWINNTLKICTARQQLVFLLRCRRHDILPPHILHMRLDINFRSFSVKRRFVGYGERYKKAILNLEIKDLNHHLNFLRSDIELILNDLFSLLPEQLLIEFFNSNSHKIAKHNDQQRHNAINKFNRISSKHNLYKAFFDNDRTKWLINIANVNIPDNVAHILSLGDRFGLPVTNLDKKDRLRTTLDTVKNFEYSSYKIPPAAINVARSSVADSLHRFLNKDLHMKYIDRYILNEFNNCKKFLKNNQDIFVTKADKGQITVIMNKTDYNDRMKDLLNDNSTYKKLNNDPSKQLTTKLNKLVRSWLDNDIIDNCDYYRLNCTNGNLPRCYGLPKVHKAGSPLRLIVSSIGSPLYNIASYLHTILEDTLPKPKSYVKDSWSFVKIIKDVTISPDHILVSFDVTSLFTNIPKDLVLKGIEKRWHFISPHTNFSLPQFLHAVDLILSSTSFCFNGQFYEQIFGSPMGSPFSPKASDIVMEDLESECLGALDFEILLFRRYVDDIFAIIPRHKLNDILDVFNSYHPRLKFTFELENNNSLPFLDTTVIRVGNRLITNWYRKPTFSGRYTNFFSSHPFKYKVNTITSLLDRAILLSDESFHTSNINTVKKILLNNSFPMDLINKHINIRIKELQHRRDTENAPKNLFDPRRSFVLPYVKGLGDDIRLMLNKIGLVAVHTVPKKLDVVIRRGKDRLDRNSSTELVYRINCDNCCASYIGQTKRHLKTRITEHFRDIRKDDSNHSVVSKHRVSLGHDFKWSDVEVLDREKNKKKREIAEMFLIKKYPLTKIFHRFYTSYRSFF